MQEQQKIIRIHSNSRPYPGYSRDSVVRKASAAPAEKPRRQSEEERIREKRRRRWERNVRKRAIERKIRERYAAANGLSFTEALIICLLAGVLLVSCAFLVYEESMVSQSVRELNSLQTACEELSDINRELESRIRSGIDAEEIYRYATEELGMKYPAKSQIITYKRFDQGYVRQGEEIVQEEER